SLPIATVSGLERAIFSTSSATASSSASAGTTRFTRPHSNAVDAEIISPVRSISSARLRPIARVSGTIGVEQKRPIFTPGVAKRLERRDQLLHQLERERVPLLRPVQRDPRNRALARNEDRSKRARDRGHPPAVSSRQSVSSDELTSPISSCAFSFKAARFAEVVLSMSSLPRSSSVWMR